MKRKNKPKRKKISQPEKEKGKKIFLIKIFNFERRALNNLKWTKIEMKRSDIIDTTKEKNLLNMIFEGNEKVYFFFSATKKNRLRPTNVPLDI